MSVKMKSVLRKTADFISKVVIENIPLFMMMGFISLFKLDEFSKILHDILMPVLLAYTAGKQFEKKYGGISSVIIMAAFLSKYEVMTLLEPIMLGAISGLIIREYRRFIKKYEQLGYEMLINNSGIVLICTLSLFLIYAFMPMYIKLQTLFTEKVVGELLNVVYIPLYALIIEPAKVLFLNNLINHGIFSVLGMSEFASKGKSIFFLLETNPGPGLGLLLAYYIYEEKNKDTLSNIFIHFIGGIHEVYFPYVLRNIYMIIPLILGGMTGIVVFYSFNLGLTGIASPGSIILILLLAPLKDKLLVLIAVMFSALITLFSSMFLLKTKEKHIKKSRLEEQVERKIEVINSEVKESVKESVEEEVEVKKINDEINKICVVCDAGMGSSAMGATFLRRKLEKAGLKKIKVLNLSVDNQEVETADIIIIHKQLLDRIQNRTEGIKKVLVDDFLNSKPYDELVAELKIKFNIKDEKIDVLKKENIKLNLTKVNKEEALINLGLDLYKSKYVEKNYVESILKREEKSTTYLGNGIAIPHGTSRGKKYINHTGIVLHQYPYGIEFGENNTVYVLIGIAAVGDEHNNIIAELADIIEDESLAESLAMALDVDEVCRILSLEESKC